MSETHIVNNENITSEMPSRQELEAALAGVRSKLSLGLATVYGSLAVFIVLISWLNFSGGAGNIKIWVVKILPLLILIPGLVKQHHRAYSWLCFVILPYFIFITPALFEAFALKNWIYLALTVIIFIAAMMTSRWLQQKSYLQWQISQTPSF